MNSIDTFDDLLQAARQQPEPQRLLLVFAAATLPDQASAAQREAVAAGHAGALAPLMCVDKDPAALHSFAALLAESAVAGPAWALVFAGALAGRAGLPPSPAQVDMALQTLVEDVRRGALGQLIPFDRAGRAVQLG